MPLGYKVLLHVLFNAVLKRIKRIDVVGFSELVHFCFSKILVFIADVFRCIYEFDVRLKVQ